MGEPSVGIPTSERPVDDQLDSWKEIASYLKRDVTTVQRWEKREGMPVHRHLHDKMGSVYASRVELDVWMRGRNLRAAQENGGDGQSSSSTALAAQPSFSRDSSGDSSRRWAVVLLLAAVGVALAV